MKVLILVEWYYPIGGIEAFVWRLIKNLDKSTQITLAVCFVGQKVELLSPASNIEIIDVTEGTFQAVQRVVTEKQPEVIHTNHRSLLGLAALYAARTGHIPLVITNHQVPEYGVYTWQRFTNPFNWLHLWLFDSLASVVTAPSPTVARLLNGHGIRKNVKTISCGVDTSLFRVRDREGARRHLRLANKPTLLFVGRLAKDKNVNVFVKAVALLKDEFDFQLLLVGPKVVRYDASDEITKLIAELGMQDHVVLVGSFPSDSEELALHYDAADIFVIPSLFETQSIVTLEAMASGLPIVASNSGALPDLVKEGGNGYLFKPLDAEDLAKKLHTLLQKPEMALRMGEESRKLAMMHDIKQTVAQFQEVYAKA